MKEKLDKLFRDKKILVLGMGREGASTLAFLKKHFPHGKIATTDQKDGQKYLSNLENFDVVIKSPGIPWKLEKISQARKNGVEFLSQTEIFLSLFREKTIGITGTKGKSTTASLIYNILKIADKNVELVGNIGKPVFDYIDNGEDVDFFVYEMSSHQLANIHLSPHIAVFLNIYPEHLDYYPSFENYLQAKKNIAKYQKLNDLFIYNSDFKEIAAFSKQLKSKKISFSKNDKPSEFGNEKLLGKHNKLNITAAVYVAKALNIDNRTINKAVASFEPLSDRLEKVGVLDGVTFINDGLATIPEASIRAVEAFQNKNITLVLGGFDRGINFDHLGKFLAGNKDVNSVILIGQTAKKIEEVLIKNRFGGKISNLGMTSMKNIVEKAYQEAKPDGFVILSPAATSFDMFKDYRDRDAQFIREIKKLNDKN